MVATQQNPAVTNRPKLLDELWRLVLERFGRPEPADRYLSWARRFVL